MQGLPRWGKGNDGDQKIRKISPKHNHKQNGNRKYHEADREQETEPSEDIYL